MGYNTYTTSDLIEDILLFSHAPTGQNTFTPARILRLANFQLQTPLLAQILSTRGGYYLTYEDYEATQDGLYVIPSDCIAGALENVELVQEPTIIPVNQIEESEQFSTNSPTSTSYGYFMRGNYVQILPTPSIGDARLWYSRRPSQMVLTSQCSQITAINDDVFTVSSVPSNLSVGSIIDVCGDQPPFNVPGDGLEITDITGTDITLAAPVPLAELGDWIALHKQTPVPQIPVEYRVMLVQDVVCKWYELQGYLDKLAAAKASFKEYNEATKMLITPRVKSQTKIVNPVNGGFMAGNQNRMSNFPAGRE